MSDKIIDKVVEEVDEPRRSALRKLIVGTAFVVPTVASFSMDGLTVKSAHAIVPNAS
jgi:hypothetical protein